MSRLKIVPDHDLCESNAVCVGIAPEVFDLDDDDHLVVRDDHLSSELLDRVREAVDSCPKRALSLRETDD